MSARFGAAVLAPLAIGTAIALSPSAHADHIFYPVGSKGDRVVGEVRADIATINENYALTMPDDMPTLVCSLLNRGRAETSLISAGEESGLPHLVAQFEVFSAEYHFCPEYY